jgi:hypothetical protein
MALLHIKIITKYKLTWKSQITPLEGISNCRLKVGLPSIREIGWQTNRTNVGSEET